MKYTFPLSLIVVLFLCSSCGLIQPPAPQPQVSATDIIPRATALSELPPTWTTAPTATPSPTLPPSQTPIPTQDPENYQIGLVMDPVEIPYPVGNLDRTGWKFVDGKTASISIPPTYEVLDFAGVFMEMMVGVMEAFAEGFLEFAEDLGEELGATPQTTPESIDLGEIPEIDFIFAVEESSQSAIILASVDRMPDTTTEMLLNEALSGSDTAFQVSTREIYVDSPLPMERVILDILDDEMGPGKQVIYVILGDQSGWNVVFTTPAGLFEQNLPIFEKTIDSFTPIQ